MIKVLEEILCSLNYAPPNAPASRENAPVSVKSGVVLHPLSDYGKTTNEDCDLLRFALFCKKCSTTGVIKLKNISPQNVPKHGIFGHFEKGINYDKNTFRLPRQHLPQHHVRKRHDAPGRSKKSIRRHSNRICRHA